MPRVRAARSENRDASRKLETTRLRRLASSLTTGAGGAGGAGSCCAWEPDPFTTSCTTTGRAEITYVQVTGTETLPSPSLPRTVTEVDPTGSRISPKYGVQVVPPSRLNST